MKTEIMWNGNVYVRGDVCGLGVPDYPQYKDTLPKDWYWRKGTTKADNGFIYKLPDQIGYLADKGRGLTLDNN